MMSDDLELPKEIAPASDRFPFVMVLTTTFLSGAMFLILDGPLAYFAANGRHFSALSELANGLEEFWKAAFPANGGVFTGFAFLTLSLVIGILLTPIDRLLTMIVVRVSDFLILRFRRDLRERLGEPFTSAVALDHTYTAFIAWLLTKRYAKAHWEWDFFNYLVFWNVHTNLAVGTALILTLCFQALSLWQVPLFILPTGIAFAFALLRSYVMGGVHFHYFTQWKMIRSSQPNP